MIYFNTYILFQDELLAELEELEQEDLDETLLNVGGTTELPSVPSTELPQPEGKFEIHLVI